MVQNVSWRIAGRTHTGPLRLGNKAVCGQLTTLIQALAIMQQVNLMTAGRTHTGPSPLGNNTVWGQSVALIQAQQSDNYLPACVTISSNTLRADDNAFKPSLFSIFCYGSLSAGVGNTVNIWQYPFSFLYPLLKIHVCKCWHHCHWLAISISSSLSPVNDPCLRHSGRSISIRQQVSLRKYARTHTGQLPLCKMSA